MYKVTANRKRSIDNHNSIQDLLPVKYLCYKKKNIDTHARTHMHARTSYRPADDDDHNANV